LPESHVVWDELAAALPDLFFSNRAQSVLARLPQLSAAADVLPDEALTRAAVILSALGHAYWRCGPSRFFPRRITQVSSELPLCIAAPWRQVSRRLGRHDPERPYQNFYDLFLSNYRVRTGIAEQAPRTIENLEVLVSCFKNEAERVFYMSFVEMHYHMTPLVSAVCDMEDAIRSDATGAVVSALLRVEASLSKATAVWNKISARPASRVFCDPVLWSKTAAILGVPPEGSPQGATSGACAPMLYAMDALLGRESYASHYGQFVADRARNFVPSSVRTFCDRIRRLTLGAYVESRRDSTDGRPLGEAFDAVLTAYAGDDGWLGRHAAKVFNYLCVSTITGRNASVSGDERYFSRQTWVSASAELHDSRAERNSGAARCPFVETRKNACAPDDLGAEDFESRASRQALVQRRRVVDEARENVRAAAMRRAAELPEYSISELARHHEDDGLWLAIDGFVYDVSTFLAKHPGGVAILQAYAGQDVGEVFWGQVVHHNPAVPAILERLLIGRLRRSDAETEDGALHSALALLTRCKQSSRMQYEHSMEGSLGLKLWSDENAHMLLLEENLPAVFELLAPGSFREIAETTDARRIRERSQHLSSTLDLSGQPAPEFVALVRERCAALCRRDLTLTNRLLELTFEAIVGTEASRASALAGRSALERRRGLAAAMRLELARYFARDDYPGDRA
jgi:cytochrome b involved in lipid metabolism